jgi:hypothetical protein
MESVCHIILYCYLSLSLISFYFIVPSVTCDFEDESDFLCGYINQTYSVWIPISYESDNDAAKASSDTGKLTKLLYTSTLVF